LSLMTAELPGKQLELLKETVPQSTRVAVLANPTAPSYQPWMHSLTVAARALGLHLHVVEVHRADEWRTSPPSIGYPRCMTGKCMWRLGA
jgi:putative ABC transport system substrate-binding protein